jgi:hypothetical protein
VDAVTTFAKRVVLVISIVLTLRAELWRLLQLLLPPAPPARPSLLLLLVLLF